MTQKLHEKLIAKRNEKFDDFMETINDGINHLWKIAKALRTTRTKIPPLETNGKKHHRQRKSQRIRRRIRRTIQTESDEQPKIRQQNQDAH
jgi:hypothetical protein